MIFSRSGKITRSEKISKFFSSLLFTKYLLQETDHKCSMIILLLICILFTFRKHLRDRGDSMITATCIKRSQGSERRRRPQVSQGDVRGFSERRRRPQVSQGMSGDRVDSMITGERSQGMSGDRGDSLDLRRGGLGIEGTP